MLQAGTGSYLDAAKRHYFKVEFRPPYGNFIKAGLYQLISSVATQVSFLVLKYSQRDLCQISNF